MMGEERMKSLLAAALKHSKAEQTEAGLFRGKWALTRFANSTIHQNMAGGNALMRVRAVFGKKVATATSNVIDEAGVCALVDQAVEMARHQDENPDFVSLPTSPQPSPSFDRLRTGRGSEAYSEATAESAPERRAQIVQSIVERSDNVSGAAAGSLSARSYERAVANSLGISSYYRGTAADVVTVVTGPEGGFGYAAATVSDIGGIDGSAIGEEAAQRASLSRNPGDIEPGEYECVLTPYAVEDMLGMFVSMGFYALPYQEGRSFLCGKMGEKIAGGSVSIWDDGLDTRTIVAPYDVEGVPKQHVDLVKDGVASGVLYDSYSAHKEGKKSTGHASGRNLVMAPGKATVEEMISSTKRGLLVTRFNYTNVAHLMTASFTGMTRDGTFLIEKGRIVGPVKNLRFTQSILEALSNVEMIGSDLKLVDNVLAPSLKVRKWRFTSGTEF